MKIDSLPRQKRRFRFLFPITCFALSCAVLSFVVPVTALPLAILAAIWWALWMLFDGGSQ